jgi:sterol 3beta-glucosyltransferase
MKVTLLTYGTRGDVQPFAALAIGLQNAGHTVRLAAPERFKDFAAQHGIPFAPLPGDAEALSKLFNDAGSTLTVVKSAVSYVSSIAADVVRAAFAASDDADLIIHSYFFTTFFTTAIPSLARAKGIPDVSVQLLPVLAPTRAFPSTAMPNLPPGVLSYLSHWLIGLVFHHASNLGYARLRRGNPDLLWMEPRWPFDSHNSHSTPLLFAYSPSVVPKPSDWTAPTIHVIGYLFLDTPASYQPPRNLVEFLEAGGPPVCVSFGSMISKEVRQIDEIVRNSLKQTHQRGIILSGWGGIRSEQPDSNIFYLDAAPHDWLFPRCKTIVHHGGAGTTGAGLRAGVPNIVVPHAGGDQFFWGRRVAAIGAGPLPIWIKQLSVANLTAAFTQVEKPELRAAAEAIGRQIGAEDGVGAAVHLIEEHAQVFNQRKELSPKYRTT